MSGHHQQRPFKTLGFGREPAVLVIDYQVAFTDPERLANRRGLLAADREDKLDIGSCETNRSTHVPHRDRIRR